jgi:hypothetical protein
VASAMRMLTVGAPVGDANIPSSADHASVEVVAVVTPMSTSRAKDDSRKPSRA